MQTPRTLEVPIDSIEGARLAAPFATRLEVCHDLSTEGWTPRMELVRACRDAVEGTPCTIVAMIRPEFPGCSRALDVAAFATTPRLLDLCLREIEAAAEARFKVSARVAHAVGTLAIGEISVIVVIRGGHRAEGFEACRWAIDAIKSAVPIWKEEHYVDGQARFLEGTPIQPVESL